MCVRACARSLPPANEVSSTLCLSLSLGGQQHLLCMLCIYLYIYIYICVYMYVCMHVLSTVDMMSFFVRLDSLSGVSVSVFFSGIWTGLSLVVQPLTPARSMGRLWWRWVPPPHPPPPSPFCPDDLWHATRSVSGLVGSRSRHEGKVAGEGKGRVGRGCWLPLPVIVGGEDR